MIILLHIVVPRAVVLVQVGVVVSLGAVRAHAAQSLPVDGVHDVPVGLRFVGLVILWVENIIIIIFFKFILIQADLCILEGPCPCLWKHTETACCGS